MNETDLRTKTILNNNLTELQQAIGATKSTNAAGANDVPYDTELERLVYQTSPFYIYLKNKGIEQRTDSFTVGYRVKARDTRSSTIDEGAAIPSANVNNYTTREISMKTYVYPIEISDMAQRGANAFDITADEVRDGIVDINMAKDKDILQGDSSADSTKFNGLSKICTSNKENLNNEDISLEAVDDLCQKIIDQGGNPSCIVTTAAVSRRLKDLIYDKRRYPAETVDTILGFNVTAYETATSGNKIPIIVDQNIDTSTDGHKLFMVTEDSLSLKTLMDITPIDLAKTKLTTSLVLANYTTFYCRAEYKNGFLYNVKPNLDNLLAADGKKSK